MNHYVLLSATAKREIEKIVDWLVLQSPAGAASWIAALEAAIASLEQDPERNALTSRRTLAQQGIRELRFATRRGRRYRVLYNIQDRVVNVLHVYAPGQNR